MIYLFLGQNYYRVFHDATSDLVIGRFIIIKNIHVATYDIKTMDCATLRSNK